MIRFQLFFFYIFKRHFNDRILSSYDGRFSAGAAVFATFAHDAFMNPVEGRIVLFNFSLFSSSPAHHIMEENMDMIDSACIDVFSRLIHPSLFSL